MKRWDGEPNEFSFSFSFSMYLPCYRHYVAVDNTVQVHFFFKSFFSFSRIQGARRGDEVNGNNCEILCTK